MTDPPTSGLLGTGAVARLLGVHPKHVYRLLKRGLPAHRLGGEWRFEREAVLAWACEGTRAAPVVQNVATSSAPPPLLAGNGDVCVELLLGILERTGAGPFGFVQADSASGHAHVADGHVLAAGVHGSGAHSSERLLKVHLTRRSVCLAFPKSRKLRSLRQLATRKLASRPTTAGVRGHLDRALTAEGLEPERMHEQALVCGSHRDVVLALLSGSADAGLVTQAWAERAGLASLPIADEDYLLCMRADALEHEPGRNLIRALQSSETKRLLGRTPGYQPRETGNVL